MYVIDLGLKISLFFNVWKTLKFPTFDRCGDRQTSLKVEVRNKAKKSGKNVNINDKNLTEFNLEMQ